MQGSTWTCDATSGRSRPKNRHCMRPKSVPSSVAPRTRYHQSLAAAKFRLLHRPSNSKLYLVSSIHTVDPRLPVRECACRSHSESRLIGNIPPSAHMLQDPRENLATRQSVSLAPICSQVAKCSCLMLPLRMVGYPT